MSAALVTVFPDNKGQRISAAAPLTLVEVECMIRTIKPARSKKDLPLLKFAEFGPHKTNAGCVRFDDNVVAVTGIEGDYDGESMPMTDAVERLRGAGVEALFYTSASHTPEKPRWRVLCFLAKPLVGTPEELRYLRKHWVGVLNAILGDVLKSESFALSQSFYIGAIDGKPAPDTVRTEGVCIDQIREPPEPVYPDSDDRLPTAAKSKDTSESADLLRKVGKLLRQGKDDDDIVQALVDHPHAKRQKDPERAVRRCIDKIHTDELQLIAEMNEAHAIINWNGQILVLTESRDPTTGRPRINLSSVGGMKIWYANQAGRFDLWIKHESRRQYEGVVFEPLREVAGFYNLWRGWGVTPQQGDCSLFLVFLREVICSGDEILYRYVLEWCADAIQNPTERPGVVLVLRGGQGTGKGTFARTIGKLFGVHFLHVRHARHLTGNFNAHLANVLLLFADEAYFPGDKTGEGSLKALITEPTMALEFKGKDVISVSNYVRVVMASNSEWVVPTAMDDRRFAILDVSGDRAQDTKYFGSIHRELESGGYEALLKYLAEYPLGEVDLRKIPDTTARHEQQTLSLDPLMAFWLQWLMEPPEEDGSGNFFGTSKIYQRYEKSTKYPVNNVSFAMRLVKIFPGARRVKQTLEICGRTWGYTLPTLDEMRADFVRAIGRTVDWPQHEEVSQLYQVGHLSKPDAGTKP